MPQPAVISKTQKGSPSLVWEQAAVLLLSGLLGSERGVPLSGIVSLEDEEASSVCKAEFQSQLGCH